MNRQLRPLFPSGNTGSSASRQAQAAADIHASLPKRQRVGVPAACDPCRKRKSRCDGRRPTCQRCYTEGVECSYATDQGETHTTALKRKYQNVTEENRQLRELFQLIHERPPIEATEIYRRIRASDDPLTVLQMVQQADLLLPLVAPNATVPDTGLHEIEEGPQGNDFIQLPARPWSVAATDRIVPEMMANLFLKRSVLARALEERLQIQRETSESSMSSMFQDYL